MEANSVILSQKVTNAELSADATYGPILKSGSVLIVDKEPTANPLYTRLFIVGQVETKSSAVMSAMQRKLLLFSDTSTYIAHAIINAATEVADSLNVGDVIEGAALRVVDTHIPYVNTTTGAIQEPRQDRNGQVYLSGGKPVYRNYELVSKEELATTHPHVILERDKAVAPTVNVVSNDIKEKLFNADIQAQPEAEAVPA